MHRRRLLNVFDLPKMLKPRYELGYLASLSCSYFVIDHKIKALCCFVSLTCSFDAEVYSAVVVSL
jgi:hypothetical protein